MTDTEKVLDAYRKAAEKFIAKVESGRASSVVTYAELKNVVELHDQLDNPLELGEG